MKFEFFLALRYLKSKKSQAFISLITIISVLGVCLGVMALIVVLSVQAGFEDDLKSKILGNSSHIVVLKYGQEKIKDYREICQKIKKIDGVRGVMPTIYSEVMLTAENGGSAGVMLKGIDPEAAHEVLRLNESLIMGAQGRKSDLSSLNENEGNIPSITIGKELSRQLLLFPGDLVTILSPVGEITPFGNQPKVKKFRVVSVFKTGMWEYDSKFAYISLEAAQDFLSLGDVSSYVEVGLFNIDKTREVEKKINQQLRLPYLTRDWEDLNGGLFDALKLEKTVTFVTLTMIIIVAAFNIIATLVMMVIEKTKDIAILKTMGATSKRIMFIFMIKGLTIGITGIILGEIFGISLSLFLKDYVKFPLNPSVYFIDTLPVKMDSGNFVLVGAAALLISFLATLYPSWKASTLKPVDGFRYE